MDVASGEDTRGGDDTSPVVRTVSFDPDEEDPVLPITELLGAELDTDPAHLLPPLEAVIDCDHLAALLADERHRQALIQMSFTYEDFRIVLDGSDRICLLTIDSHST